MLISRTASHHQVPEESTSVDEFLMSCNLQTKADACFFPLPSHGRQHAVCEECVFHVDEFVDPLESIFHGIAGTRFFTCLGLRAACTGVRSVADVERISSFTANTEVQPIREHLVTRVVMRTWRSYNSMWRHEVWPFWSMTLVLRAQGARIPGANASCINRSSVSLVCVVWFFKPKRCP